MKRILALTLASAMAFTLAACGGSSSTNESESAAAEEALPPDLTGEWTQVNSTSDDSYHYAVISGDTITIYWVYNDDDTKSLYWAGTFVAPTSTDEPYTWESENDHDQTDLALLASGDDTKVFTYEDGQISYEGSILGTTSTYRLEKTAELSEVIELDETDEELDAASLGASVEEIVDCIPEEDKYDHGLDEEETQGMIDVTASLLFDSMNEDDYPDLNYGALYTDSVALIDWYSSNLYAESAIQAMDGDESSIEAWNSVRDLMLSGSDLIEASLSVTVAEDYHGLFMILNNDNAEKVLMASYRGEIIYDAAEDVPEVDLTEEAEEEQEAAAVDDESVPSEYISALNRAESYSENMHMSKQGIYDQLTSEYGDNFDADAAQYAVDNLDADWNANALETAQSYSDTMHMSKQGIYDQLISEYGEKFTADEAQYAVDNVIADWNENALETAKNYRDNMDMSASAIHDQLTSEYGEKFTEEEADYAIANLD